MTRSSPEQAGERRAVLHSYGGASARCGLVAPPDIPALAEQLAAASRAGRRITFRGGGCAMDTQSLGTDLVISLDQLRGLRFLDGDARLEAAAGERWGDVVRAAHRRARQPAVTVTTARASVAGTTAGNCVSRWTPVRGPDAEHVHAVELVTARGQRRRLTRGDPELDAVIGGLGYLGAITKVELSLLPHPHDQVETHVVAAGATAEVLAACAPAHLSPGGDSTVYGVLLPDLARGLAYRSRPVSGQTLRPFLAIHQPRSALRLAGELLVTSHTGARLVGDLAFRRRRDRYVDPLFDYTFFMDGDARLRQLGRRLGLTLPIIQQSFAVPVAAAAELIELARRAFAERDVSPILTDVLYCPADRALLSATYQRAGFLVSFAFSPRTRARLARVHLALAQLSRHSLLLGGRVRLAKSVCAGAGELAEMYRDGLPRFRQIKRALDPDGLLRNEFLERVLPSLVED